MRGRRALRATTPAGRSVCCLTCVTHTARKTSTLDHSPVLSGSQQIRGSTGQSAGGGNALDVRPALGRDCRRPPAPDLRGHPEQDHIVLPVVLLCQLGQRLRRALAAAGRTHRRRPGRCGASCSLPAHTCFPCHRAEPPLRVGKAAAGARRRAPRATRAPAGEVFAHARRAAQAHEAFC